MECVVVVGVGVVFVICWGDFCGWICGDEVGVGWVGEGVRSFFVVVMLVYDCYLFVWLWCFFLFWVSFYVFCIFFE